MNVRWRWPNDANEVAGVVSRNFPTGEAMTIPTRFLLQVIGAVTISLLTPVSSGAPALLLAATPEPAHEANAALAPRETLNDCYWCTNLPGGSRHVFSSETCPVGSGSSCRVCDETDINGETAPCHPGFDESGTCDNHRLCEASRMSPADNAALVAAVQRGDARTVQRIIESHPGTLRVNEARRVIQWFDCSGSVHSQLELSAALTAKL